MSRACRPESPALIHIAQYKVFFASRDWTCSTARFTYLMLRDRLQAQRYENLGSDPLLAGSHLSHQRYALARQLPSECICSECSVILRFLHQGLNGFLGRNPMTPYRSGLISTT